MGWRPHITRRLVRIYVAIFLSSFSNCYVIAMLYPFLPFMVQFLLPNVDAVSINKYAGVVATAFYIGRLVGSYVWGVIADCIGRKPVLIICGLLLTVTSVLFGFSINFAMCVLARFFMGLSCGILVTVRAVISESSNDANQAFGFSIITFSWLLAVVVSSAVSGVTADPIGQYNLTLPNGTLKSFLTDYPYAPPSLINCVMLVLGVLSVIFLLPETLSRNKHVEGYTFNSQVAHDVYTSTADSILPVRTAYNDDTVYTTENEDTEIVSATQNDIADNNEHDLTQSSETINNITSISSNNEINDNLLEHSSNSVIGRHRLMMDRWTIVVNHGSKKLMKDLKYILCNKPTMLATLSHCILAGGDVGLDTLYALWSATAVNMGGVGFTVKEIGLSSSISAALLTPFSLIAYPLLEKKFGSIHTCQMSVIILMFCTILFPNIHHLTLISDLNPAVLWTVLIIFRLVSIVFLETCFAAQCLLINNSVSSDKLGSANGLAVSLSDIFRAVFLAVTGGIYSASLSMESSIIGFPLNYNLTFVLYGACFLVISFLTACLPDSVNRKKI